MDEKEFDEKYKQYWKEANDEIKPKLQEKSQKIADDFKKQSKDIKKNSNSTDEYIANYFSELGNTLADYMELSETRTNSLNYRVLKKFFTSK